jgi:RHS repeat-associated protein
VRGHQDDVRGSRRLGRRRQAVAFVSSLLALSLLVGVAFAAGGQTGATGDPFGFVNGPALRQELAKVAHQRDFRASQQGRDERAASKSAYRGLDDKQAAKLMRRQFARLFEDDGRRLKLRGGDRVVSFESDHAALIEDPNGHRSIAFSPTPLAARDASGTRKGVDFTPEKDQGGWRARNSASEVRFGAEAPGGIDFTRDGIAVKPAFGNGATGIPVATDVFYGNVASDTDFKAGAAAPGASFALQLRSPASPESFSFTVDLPDGARLEARHAPAPEVRVVRGVDDVLMRMSPPIAFDAQGAAVPTDYEVAGNVVTVRVPHRSKDFAYPIAVDPTLSDNFDWEGHADSDYSNWHTRDANWGHHYATGDIGWGAGLNVYNDPGVDYPWGTYGMWYWQARGNSFFKHADFSNLTFWDMNQNNACVQIGIGVLDVGWDPNEWVSCTGGEYAQGIDSNGTPGNVVAAALSNAGPTGSYADLVELGTLSVQVGDNSPPTITPDTSTTSGWIEGTTTRNVALVPRDPGVGVKTYGLSVPQTSGTSLDRSTDYGCSGHRVYCYPDSPSTNPFFPVDFSTVPEGNVTFKALAVDAVGNPTAGANGAPTYGPEADGQNIWTMHVDRSAPTLSGYGGELAPGGHGWVKDGVHQLTYNATDPNSGVSQSSVTVSDSTFARDSFNRTTSNGWGTADSGGTWGAWTGSDADFATNGSAATVALRQSVNSLRRLSTTARDVDARVRVALPTVTPPSGETSVSLGIRDQGAVATPAVYQARLVRDATGRLLLRATGNSASPTLGADVDTGLQYTPGAEYWLRAQVTGASPTNIKIKAWEAGTPEPQSWPFDRTDSTLGPQIAGYTGLGGKQTGSSTPLTLGLDDYSATDVGTHRYMLVDNHCTIAAGCPTSSAASFTWDTSGESEGPHTFTAGASDPFATDQPNDAVHSFTRQSWTVGVDRTNPTFSNETGSLATRDGVVGLGTQTLDVDTADTLSGVQKVELLIGDNPVGQVDGDCTQVQCSQSKHAHFTWDSSDSSGRLKVTVRVTDLAGNSVDDTWYVIVDATPPTITSLTGTLAPVAGGIPWVAEDRGNLAVSSQDADGGVQSSEISMGPLVVARDAFERTSTGGWGDADQGGAWNQRDGSASNFATIGSRGTMAVPGTTQSVSVGAISARDVDARVDVALEGPAPTAGEDAGGLVLRRTATNQYRVVLVRDATGGISVRIRDAAGDSVAPDVPTGVTDILGGTQLRLRARISGASPTSVKVKAWKAGTAEPAAWLVDVTDSTLGPQVGGEVGVRGAQSTGQPSRLMSFDNFAVSDLVVGVRDTAPASCNPACPTTFTQSFDWSSGADVEGLHTMGVKVTDAASYSREAAPWSVGLDRTPPALSLSGPLKDNAGRALSKGSYNLHVDALDGDASSPETQNSGVKSVRVEVDGVDSTTTALDDSQACATGNCEMHRDWAFRPADYAPGAYTIKVTTTDQVAVGADAAGHTTQQSFIVVVDAVPAGSPNGQGLENWFRYHDTPTGAGSAAHVNLANGNMVWHWAPMVNPGRGLSSVVDLTYNSQAPLGTGTALSYDEVGRGFSLGISGITRVNEPLDLSRAALGIVTLTDRDGTRHQFHSGDVETYDPPPGVHLHLRRFSQIGIDPSALLHSDRAWAATRPDGVTYYFDAAGYATWIEDRNGNQIHFEYEYASPAGATFASVCGAADPSGLGADLKPACVHRLKAVRDAAGLGSDPNDPSDDLPNRTIDLTYAGDTITNGRSTARIAQITDHLGHALDFNYDADGYLDTVSQGSETRPSNADPIEPATRALHFGYEAPDTVQPPTTPRYMLSVQDPRGSTTEFGYESRDSTGTAARRTVSVKARGVATATGFAYEENGDTCEAATCTTVTDALSHATSDKLDSRGRLASSTDPRGAVTQLLWDDAGSGDCNSGRDDNQVCQITRAAGSDDETTTTMAYNQNGRLTYQRDGMNGVTTFQYRDGPGNQLSERGNDAGGTFVSDLTSMTTPRGYAPGGANPADFTYTFTPDERGNVIEQHDPLGAVAKTTFDPATGVVTREEDWSDSQHTANVTTYDQYDANGFPRVMVDARGNEPGGDPTQHRWFYTYDDAGNLRHATDPRGTTSGTPDSIGSTSAFTTSFSYDSLDRLLTQTVPRDSRHGVFASRTTAYDDNGNVVSKTDGNHHETITSYTPMDRPEDMQSPATPHAGHAGDQRELTHYDYDANQNLTRVVAPNGTSSGAPGSYGNDYSTEYTYNSADQLVSQTRHAVGSPGGTQDLITKYTLDLRGNVRALIDPRRVAQGEDFNGGGIKAFYRLDANDRVTDVTADYGELNRVTHIRRDADGNVTGVTDPRGTWSGDPNLYTTRYVYDADGRLTDTIAPNGDDTRRVLRPDGLLEKLIKPSGFSGGAPTGNFESLFDYYPTGELRSFTLPEAPGQYHREGSGKWTFCRDSAGDATEVLDPRASGACDSSSGSHEPTYRIDSTFFDNGEPMTTTRPSFWSLSAGGSRVSEPSPDELLTRTQSPGDTATGASGGSGGSPGASSFGSVGAQKLPGILPKKGLTTFGYDDEMQLQSVSAGGLTTTLHYDPTDRLTEVIQPLDAAAGRFIHNTFAYDYNGNLAQQKDGRGLATDFDYDQFDRKIAIHSPAPHDAAAGAQVTTTLGYDESGNLTSVVNPRGKTTRYTYDQLDRRQMTIAPDGATTLQSYDYAGNPSQTWSPCRWANPKCASGGSITNFVYDAENRLSSATDPSGTTNYSYDPDGNVKTIDAPGAQRSPDGSEQRQVETRTYDGRDLPWKDTTGSGDDQRTTVTEYDAYGDLRRSVNPAGVSSDGSNMPKHADVAQLVTPSSDSANPELKTATEQASLFEYSPDGQLTTAYMPWGDKDTKDGRRYRQDFHLDDLGRVDGVSTPHEWDDGVDHTHTAYSHYDTGWVRTSTDYPTAQFGNEKVEYQYDGAGNQTRWCAEPVSSPGCGSDSRRIVTRDYFPSGDLKSRTAEQTSGGASRSYDYQYDDNSNLTQFHDSQSGHTTNSTYDANDRNLSVNEAWSGGKDTVLTYDFDGNVTKRRTDGHLTDPTDLNSYTGGKTTDFTYDSLDHELATIIHPADGDPRRMDTEYWPSGDPSKQTRINGADATDQVRATDSLYYADDGRLIRRDRAPRVGDTDTQDFTYDSNANRTKDKRGTYEYNSRDQLTKWVHDGKTVTYDLNGSGSVTQKCEEASCTTFDYVGESGRLQSATTDGGLPVHYCYDDSGSSGQAGDLTSIQAGSCGATPGANDIVYKYDKFDRMTSSTGQGASGPTAYHYDALDRRDSQCTGGTGDACTGGAGTGLGYIGLTSALSSEQRGGGSSQDRRYDYDSQLNRLGTDWENGSGGTTEYRSYATGPDGTVEGLQGADGSIAANETYKYDPYGADSTDTSPAPGTPPPSGGSGGGSGPTTTLDQAAQDNPFRFQGFYYDSAIKSYDMQAREYQPLVGRFTTPDRFESGAADFSLQADPLTQDRYAFAGGNPVNKIESDGHCGGGGGPCTPYAGSPGFRRHFHSTLHRQQTYQHVQSQGYTGYYPSADYQHETGIIPHGAATPPPPRELLPGVNPSYVPNYCNSFGGNYAGCAAGRMPPKNDNPLTGVFDHILDRFRPLIDDPVGVAKTNATIGLHLLTGNPKFVTQDIPNIAEGLAAPYANCKDAEDCLQAAGADAVILGVGAGTGEAVGGGAAAGDASAASGLGDLTAGETAAIQSTVDQAGRPLEVVGSAARGERRAAGSKLPIGKGQGTRSDIDYLVPPGSRSYYQGLQNGLPAIDPNSGLLFGVHNPFIGPAIRFEPGAQPRYLPPK